EEQAILGHCEVDTRRGQHTLTKKTGSRNRDTTGDSSRAKVSECAAHHVRCGRRRSSETGTSEHADVDDIRSQVKQHDTSDTEEQSARQILSRLFYLTGDKCRCLPTAVREDDWHKCRAKRGQQID